jgi:sugar phosphate isomerase/epimerase
MPLSSPRRVAHVSDEAVPLTHHSQRKGGIEAIRTAIEFAGYLNCGALLLVAGRAGAGPRFEIGSEDTRNRLSGELKKALPFAERARVILTLENVSNCFLVSLSHSCDRDR